MRMPRWMPAGPGIGSYRQQLEAIAEEMFCETSQHFSADDLVKQADHARDDVERNARGREGARGRH